MSATWLTLTAAHMRNLKGFDLRLPLGRLIMVAGPSGAGKSTLFRDLLHPAVAHAIKTNTPVLRGAAFVKATGFEDDTMEIADFGMPDASGPSRPAKVWHSAIRNFHCVVLEAGGLDKGGSAQNGRVRFYRVRHGRVQQVAEERGFARAARPGDHDKPTERQAQVEALEVAHVRDSESEPSGGHLSRGLKTRAGRPCH